MLSNILLEKHFYLLLWVAYVLTITHVCKTVQQLATRLEEQISVLKNNLFLKKLVCVDLYMQDNKPVSTHNISVNQL